MRSISKVIGLVLVVMLCLVAVVLAAPVNYDGQENAEARLFEHGIEENNAEETSSSTTIHLVKDPYQADGTAYAYVSMRPTEAVNEAEGGMAAGGEGILFLSLLAGAILTIFLIQFKLRNSKFNRKQGLLLTTLLMLGALAVMPIGVTGSGTIIYADVDAVGLNDGTSWADAYTDLQNALGTATASDEIWVAEGTYKPTTGTDRTATFQLIYYVDLYGGFNGTETARNQGDWEIYETILSGDIGTEDDTSDNSYNVVKGYYNATISGFTITKGNADHSFAYEYRNGGGMFNHFDSLAVTNCTFTDNTAIEGGGGMYNDAGFPMVINCTFTDNLADLGGGMYNYDCRPMVLFCTFTDNLARNGGGMYNHSSAPIVESCTFTGNSDGIGGGMYNLFNYYGSNPMVYGCTFTGNSTGRGGGMYNEVSSPTVTNCEFIENSAFINGGGMNNKESSPRVINCTFNSNTAGMSGGGMFNDYGSNSTVTNCIFSGNTADTGGGMFNDYGSNSTVTNCTFNDNIAIDGGGIWVDWSSLTVTNSILWGDIGSEIYSATGTPVVTYSCIEGGYTGTGNIDLDPLFVNPFFGDYHLHNISPCIDVGDVSSLPADTPDLDYDGDTSEPIPLDLDMNDRVVDIIGWGNDGPNIHVVDMGAYEYVERLSASYTLKSSVDR